MRKTLIISLFAAILAAPAVAQPATGMGALQYYVGAWSCVAGATNQPPVKATATFAADSGVLRQWVMVPAQGKMKTPYAFSAALTYDAKKHRYVQTSLDNQAVWDVSSAKPWTGNIEQWTDMSNNEGKLGRAQIVRTDSNSFAVTGYETMTSAKPNLRVTCKRSS